MSWIVFTSNYKCWCPNPPVPQNVTVFRERVFFCCCFCFCFQFYFIFKLYIIVLVLPNIKMNLPQVYMCSPSWTLLPPHSIPLGRPSAPATFLTHHCWHLERRTFLWFENPLYFSTPASLRSTKPTYPRRHICLVYPMYTLIYEPINVSYTVEISNELMIIGSEE